MEINYLFLATNIISILLILGVPIRPVGDSYPEVQGLLAGNPDGFY